MATVIILSATGAGSFARPADWNDALNTVEVISAGGGGASINFANGGGGQGGAYAKAVNVTLGSSTDYSIGVGGAGGGPGANGSNGGDTWFGGSSLGSCFAGAQGGQGGQGTSGGNASQTVVGLTSYAGGAGADGPTDPGGGGGAGGPNGIGAAGAVSGGSGGGGGGGGGGGSAGSNHDGGHNWLGTGGGIAGGAAAADGGGGAGGTGGRDGQVGSNGNEFAPGQGSGGGGGGADFSHTGGAGGLYGGGGGGGSAITGGAGGAGAQGIIVLTYEPAFVRIAEANVSAVVTFASPARISEANISAVVYAASCATQRCDLWMIKRTDGMIFAFTSLDRDFTWLNVTYRTCASLQDSATSDSTEIGSVGGVTLTGLLSDYSITDADLYGGLFDDAYVESWVVTWGGGPDPNAPFRVAAGWIGKVTRGQASYTAEVNGPGSRLQQATIVKFFTPGCRWEFGSSECGVNKEALKISGITVTNAVGRYAVEFAPQSVPSETAIWNDGQLVWTYGRNAGTTCQTETVDWTSGILSLWDLAPFPPEVGDTFDLLPGCTYDTTGCVYYSNLINFGGFPNVPGPDALQQNADSLYTGNGG